MVLDDTREIPKTPRCPDLDATDERRLTELCFQSASVEDADLIFVFGNNVQHNVQARLVSDLCERYPGASLILTGGLPQYSESIGGNLAELAESEALENELRSLIDLDSREVFLEKKSRNTRENVLFARDIIRKAGSRNIMFLSQSFAVGRSAMTIQAILPELNRIGGVGMDRHVGAELLSESSWTASMQLHDIVWGEFLRIFTYGNRGDIDSRSHWKTIAQISDKHLT